MKEISLLGPGQLHKQTEMCKTSGQRLEKYGFGLVLDKLVVGLKEEIAGILK